MKAEVLDNVEHHNLKLTTKYGEEFGHNRNMVLALPTEYMFLQKEYPILIQKNDEGDYISVALLGFDVGENLFIEDGKWKARFIPSLMASGPFYINMPDKDSNDEPKILVDIEDKRISREVGEKLFLDQGGNSAILEKIKTVLQNIHFGNLINGHFFESLDAAQLIKPADMSAKLANNTVYNFEDMYTIDGEKLRNLSGEVLEELNKKGFLASATYLLASLDNMVELIAKKSKKLGFELIGDM